VLVDSVLIRIMRHLVSIGVNPLDSIIQVYLRIGLPRLASVCKVVHRRGPGRPHPIRYTVESDCITLCRIQDVKYIYILSYTTVCRCIALYGIFVCHGMQTRFTVYVRICLYTESPPRGKCSESDPGEGNVRLTTVADSI